ncbi:hypothetical protein [Rhizobium sp. SSA_523]|uniref:hypothetical protein n=1 Tax=Rhizobium sp. SSA_523 TaxID=2952477 RepID=UPI0020914354|nr:hypothetical protein [Rhizobium sp. SSA_523]MCO5729996.1 hypothetical protein [Rhizobium sp. SSA_523]WKC25070.1 hypothetical protein QTJ18_13830 [Rhizobium sp. SSA_523]
MPNTMNAALLILSQPVRAAAQEANAVDTILSIVHEQKKAGPRAVGGTVSSEISSAQESAMAAGAKASLNSKPQARGFSVMEYDAQAAASGFFPIERSKENADALADMVATRIADYNAQFKVRDIPTFEEYVKEGKDRFLEENKRSFTEERLKELADSFYSENGYKRRVEYMEGNNKSIKEAADDAYRRLLNIRERFQEIFGVDLKLKFDEHGRASVDPFEVRVDGKLLMNYEEHSQRPGLWLFMRNDPYTR